MKQTVEGIRRGSLIWGPLGRQHYLFCVNRVYGKHSVGAVAEIDGITIEITLHTNGISAKDSKWKRVEAGPEPRGQGHAVLAVISDKMPGR